MKKIKKFLAFYFGADQTVLEATRLIKKLEGIKQLEKICAHETALRISYQDAVVRMSNDLSRAHGEIQNLTFHLREAEKKLGIPPL